MKKELLEHLIRLCVREVLDNVGEEESPTIGATAPPAGSNQGTGDQPPLDDETPPKVSDDPEKKETPDKKPESGAYFINPANKAKLQPLKISNTDMDSDTIIARHIRTAVAAVTGAQYEVDPSTIQLIKSTISNANIPTYIYIGKPNKVVLMADTNLQNAKDSSVSPEEELPSPIHTRVTNTNVSTQTSDEQPPSVTEQQFREIVKKLVNEILNKK